MKADEDIANPFFVLSWNGKDGLPIAHAEGEIFHMDPSRGELRGQVLDPSNVSRMESWNERVGSDLL